MNTEDPQPAEASPGNSGARPAPLSSPSPQPFFPRAPGETPRAFSAFMTFFQLGHARSCQAVADKLGEGLPTVKNWASKHDWSERLQAFNSGLLQQQALDQAALQRRQAADRAARLASFREQEWDAAQKLITAAQCFLETFDEEALHKMTLAQVSRALKASSALARSALADAELPSVPSVSPAQQQLLDALKRLYGQSRPSPAEPENPPATLSLNSPPPGSAVSPKPPGPAASSPEPQAHEHEAVR